jgi:hypothetical protein
VAQKVRKTLPFTATFSIQICLFVAAPYLLQRDSDAEGSDWRDPHLPENPSERRIC